LDKPKKEKRTIRFDIDDILILLGAAGVFGGIWLIYHPAAYIAGGVVLLFLGMNKKKKQGT
jgi:hypothetical protein